MELLDRYLQAVKLFLPRPKRDDILAELSANILSQVEDREAELGRPLDEVDQVRILKQVGHPMLVAAGYRRAEHPYLLGPVVFPFYAFVIQVMLGVMAAVCVLNAAMVVGGEPARSTLQALLAFPRMALPAFGWVTLEFAALDFIQARFHLVDRLNRWDPRSLPAVARSATPIPRSRSVFGLVAEAVLLLWWIAAPRFPFLILGPSAGLLELGPGWHGLYVPGIFLGLAGLIQRSLSIAFPQRTGLRSLTGLIFNGCGIVLMQVALKSYPFVVAASSSPPGYRGVAESVNVALFSTALFVALPWLWIAGALHALGCAQNLLRLLRRSREASSSHVARLP